MRKRMPKWAKRAVIALTVIVFLFILVVTYWLFFKIDVMHLPNFRSFEEYRPYQTSYFFDRSGEVIGCMAEQWRDVIRPANPLTLLVTRIILQVEDQRFYERDLGVDVRAIGRAFIENIKSGKVVEGGSTIPQQLVKRLLPIEEQSQRSMERKAKEFFLARGLVKNFSKDQIFLLYLNEIYLGHQRYGIEAASRFYFGKTASDLELADAALLTGLIQAPERFSPKKHKEEARRKRNEILRKIKETGLPSADNPTKHEFISDEEYRKAVEAPIILKNDFEKSCKKARHAIDYARDFLAKEYGLLFNDSRDNMAWYGIRVTTTIDAELQQYANDGINHALQLYRERQKENAIWADGAVYVIDNTTGGILALVGSSDYGNIQRNNAVNGNRQPGSAFKPIVYAALFEEELLSGISRERILDTPISNVRFRCKGSKPGEYWSPNNFDEDKYSLGSYTRRFAIAKSINRPAVHAARIPKTCGLHPRVSQMAERLGISTKIEPYLPSALGATGISLAELVGAYSVFANNGIMRKNYIVERVADAKNLTLHEKNSFSSKRVFHEEIADKLSGLITEALRGVVKHGTGYQLKSLKQPVAGKTGTTNDYSDAGFMGYTPDITFGVWIGSPTGRISLGERETGGTTAIPAIKYLLEHWYQDQEPIPFPEEIERWVEILKNPAAAFEKEMKSDPTEKEEEIERKPAQ